MSLLFCPSRFGIPLPTPKLAKGLRPFIGNAPSSSALHTDTANKTRQLIFVVMRYIQGLLKWHLVENMFFQPGHCAVNWTSFCSLQSRGWPYNPGSGWPDKLSRYVRRNWKQIRACFFYPPPYPSSRAVIYAGQIIWITSHSTTEPGQDNWSFTIPHTKKYTR